MLASYRQVTRGGMELDPKRVVSQKRRWRFVNIPYSMLLNFCAFFLILSLIYILHSMGQKLEKASAPEQPHVKIINTASIPAQIVIATPQPLETPKIVEAPKMPEIKTTVVENTLSPQISQPEITAQSAPEIIAKEESPRIDVKKTKIATQKAIAEKKMRRNTFAEDRNFDIGQLDNEPTRQRYLTENRKIPTEGKTP